MVSVGGGGGQGGQEERGFSGSVGMVVVSRVRWIAMEG